MTRISVDARNQRCQQGVPFSRLQDTGVLAFSRYGKSPTLLGLWGPFFKSKLVKGGGGSSSCQVTWLCHPLLHVRTFVITLGYLGQPACSPYFTVNRWADLLQSATLISRCHITYHRLWRLWHARFRAEKVSYHIKVLMSKRVIVRLVRRWGMKARTFT